MTVKQRDLIAIVFDMKEGQLKATLYQIIMGDPVDVALDKAMAHPPKPPKSKQESLLK